MWYVEFPDEDEPDTSESGSIVFLAIWFAIFLAALIFVVVFATAVLGVFATVGFWPKVQPFLDSQLLRIALALSLFTIGIGFYHIRRNYPRFFATVEILFALVLVWVALGDATADRLAIVLAILASSFVFASAIQLWLESRPVADDTPQIRVGRNQIQIYRRGERLAVLPRDLNGVAYRIDVKALTDRIEQLERRLIDSGT